MSSFLLYIAFASMIGIDAKATPTELVKLMRLEMTLKHIAAETADQAEPDPLDEVPATMQHELTTEGIKYILCKMTQNELTKNMTPKMEQLIKKYPKIKAITNERGKAKYTGAVFRDGILAELKNIDKKGTGLVLVYGQNEIFENLGIVYASVLVLARI